MNRRSLLAWLTRGLAALSAVLVAAPGWSYITAPLRPRSGRKSVRQRVARWADLPSGRPIQVSIVGSRRDAWTVHPDEVIGRVWLVRSGEVDSTPTADSVRAFATVCPHLGCQIQHEPKKNYFVCPCHRAAFDLQGGKLSEDQLGHTNHSPRAMDRLECAVVEDKQTGQWWVEVQYEKFQQGLTQSVRIS